jgi:hypothetical protein
LNRGDIETAKKKAKVAGFEPRRSIYKPSGKSMRLLCNRLWIYYTSKL